jgi:hypothetical protein
MRAIIKNYQFPLQINTLERERGETDKTLLCFLADLRDVEEYNRSAVGEGDQTEPLMY